MMFSIIVPCYNCKNSVRNCLESIIKQNYYDFEVILVDDGSTDGTSQILDEYAFGYPFIHAYHFINEGVSFSRRRGITLATGDYLIFVDSDDTINPNLLYELHVAMKQHGSPDMIRYQSHLVGDDAYKDHQRYNFYDSLNVTLSGMEALKRWSVSGKKYAVYWLFAFKRNIFSTVLFSVSLRCYEDVALIPILIAVSNKVLTIHYVGYNYTCNNMNSLTNTQSLASERARAMDFLNAYKYAIENFSKLDHVSSLDIAFFYQDYTRRLQQKYNSLPDKLKEELASEFAL